MGTDAPLPKDHPALVAWETYKSTEDFENTKRWALEEKHTDGSLWAAFYQGWSAIDAATAAKDQQIAAITTENGNLKTDIAYRSRLTAELQARNEALTAENESISFAADFYATKLKPLRIERDKASELAVVWKNRALMLGDIEGHYTKSQAEVSRLTAELAEASRQLEWGNNENKQAVAERDRLREALESIRTHWKLTAREMYSMSVIGQVVEKALEPTP